MKTEELSGKRKRAPTKTFVSAESQKKMRVSKRDKGKVQYNTDDNSGSEEEEDYEVKFIVEDRFIKGKRQFKVRWVNYGPKDDTWVNEADMSCPRLVTEFEDKKKPDEEEEDDDDDDAADYEVEECVDVREVKGKKEFLIKWKNFASKNNTWEPESNLDCPLLMKKCVEMKKSGKAAPAKKSPKKPAVKAKKAAPKKGAKRGRKSAKNGKKSDDEAEENEEEQEAAEDEPEKEAEAGDETEEKEEGDGANKEEGEDEEESKNDADDEDDDKVEDKVEDKKRSKPGPKSKKKK